MLRPNASTVLLSLFGLTLASFTFACSGSTTDNADVDTSKLAVQEQKDGKPTGDGKTCSWGVIGAPTPVMIAPAPTGGSSGGCTTDDQGNTKCWSSPPAPEPTPAPAPLPTPAPVAETYQLGDWFPAPDGCNKCTCTDLGIMCTVQLCAPPPPPPAPGCEANGKQIEPGTSFSDGCNTCSCGPDGQLACTAMACPPAPTPVPAPAPAPQK